MVSWNRIQLQFRYNELRYNEKFVVTSAGPDPIRSRFHKMNVKKLSL